MGRRKDKWTKKTVNFFRYVFKFIPPFKIIIDGNFIAISLQKKIDMKTSLEKLLNDKVRLIIPRCIFKEIQLIEEKIPGILSTINQYKIEECEHNQIDPISCIRNYIGKKNHDKYFVATQDDFLRKQLRQIPGVPLIFFGQNMLLIDKLSAASLYASERRENLKEAPQKKEQKILKEKKNEIKEFLIEEFKNSKYYKRKREEYKLNKLMGKIRKKAKAPNPLSVKKKKSYYEQLEKDKKYKEEHQNGNENDNTIDNMNENKEGNNEFLKKKRKLRGKKRKLNNL
jgi:U3 small nucleolar RNA-associated protein 23